MSNVILEPSDYFMTKFLIALEVVKFLSQSTNVDSQILFHPMQGAFFV